MKGAIESAPAASTSLWGNQGPIGHVRIAGQVGVPTDPDFWQATEEIMRPGGDQEANASVAGAVFDAHYWHEHIPTHGLSCVPEPKRLNRLARDLLSVQRRIP